MKPIRLRKHSPGFWECADGKDAPLLRHITGGASIVSLLHDWQPVAEAHGWRLVVENQGEADTTKEQ